MFSFLIGWIWGMFSGPLSHGVSQLVSLVTQNASWKQWTVIILGINSSRGANLFAGDWLYFLDVVDIVLADIGLCSRTSDSASCRITIWFVMCLFVFLILFLGGFVLVYIYIFGFFSQNPDLKGFQLFSKGIWRQISC